MEVVDLRPGFHQVVAAHEASGQAHAAAGLDHQHRQVAAGAHPFLEGAAGGPGGTDVPLGVFHPVLDDLQELVQEAQGALIAAHQSLLGQIHRRRIVLTIGQPALDGPHQVAVETAHRIGELGLVAGQAGFQRRRRAGFHLADRLHQEGLGAAVEAGPQDLITAGRHQGIELIGLGGDAAGEVDQPLEAVAAGLEAEAMVAEQNGGAVAVAEGVGYAGTHAGSELEGVSGAAEAGAMK